MYDAIDISENRGRKSTKQPVGAAGDRVEYRLHVIRRTGDHLEDVGRRGLPLQRLLGLVEQSYIFDGDDGLVGEGLKQSELPVRKFETGLRMRENDTADALVFADQRHEDDV